jgi:cullin 3
VLRPSRQRPSAEKGADRHRRRRDGRGALCRSWEKLQDAIQHIFNENAGDLSFEELYRTGYNMVLHKHGDLLYSNVELVLKDRSTALCEKVERNSDET